MITFTQLCCADFPRYAPMLFRILAGNMNPIAPTGNTYEEDYQLWYSCNLRQLTDSHRTLLLISVDHLKEPVGYFMYSLKNAVWYMEEIQILPAYQHTYGIFRTLYGYLLEALPEKPTFVEAYAHKNNAKSIAILTCLGLFPFAPASTRTNLRFRGTFADLLRWYNRKPL